MWRQPPAVSGRAGAAPGGGGLTSSPGRPQGEAPVPAEHPGGSRPQGRAGDGSAIAAGQPSPSACAPAGERGPGPG